MAASDDGIVVGGVPEISRFFGIVVGMFFSEHGRPHFHAICAGQKISVDIESGLVRGHFPIPATRLVLEWNQLHRQELLDNWERARRGETLMPIAPLE